MTADLATGSVLEKVGTGAGSTTSPSGLAKLAAWADNFQLDPTALYAVVRDEASPVDAECMIWALDQAFAAGRVDPLLLDHLAAAAICAVAYRDDTTPRLVAEQLFRRVVADESWRDSYAGLLDRVGG